MDKKLLCSGWTVIRFWGNDIKNNTEECVRVIEEVIFDGLVESDVNDEYYNKQARIVN